MLLLMLAGIGRASGSVEPPVVDAMVTGGGPRVVDARDYRFLNPEQHRPKQVKKAIARAARRVIARGVDVPQSAAQQILAAELQHQPQPVDMALLTRQIELQRYYLIQQAAIRKALQTALDKAMTATQAQPVEDDDERAIVMMLFEMV